MGKNTQGQKLPKAPVGPARRRLRSSGPVEPDLATPNERKPAPRVRKSASKALTESYRGEKEFDELKRINKHKLPADIHYAFSRQLLQRQVETGKNKKNICILRTGCYKKKPTTTDRPAQRPSVNLANTKLSKENLKPEYHHLAFSQLSFGNLASVMALESVASIRHKRSVRPKLARLACLLADSQATPERMRACDASHLCGTASCFSPDHVVFETHEINMSREKCFKGKETSPCPHAIPCLLGERDTTSQVEAAQKTRPQTRAKSAIQSKAKRPTKEALEAPMPFGMPEAQSIHASVPSRLETGLNDSNSVVSMDLDEAAASADTEEVEEEEETTMKYCVRKFLSFWDRYRA